MNELDDDLVRALHAEVADVTPDPAAWATLQRGARRRRRQRRATALTGTLALLLVAVPAGTVVSSTVDRLTADRATVVVPAAPTEQREPALWPVFTDAELAGFADDPGSRLYEVGLTPGRHSLATPEAATQAFASQVLFLDPDAAVGPAQVTGGRALVTLERPDAPALEVRLVRPSAEGPWLVVGVEGSRVAIDSPAPDAALRRGDSLSGAAPAGVTSVYVQVFHEQGHVGQAVDVVGGRWSVGFSGGEPAGGRTRETALQLAQVPAGPATVFVAVLSGNGGPDLVGRAVVVDD